MRKYALVLAVSVALAVSGGIGLSGRSDPPSAEPIAADLRITPGDGRNLTAVIDRLEETLRRVPDDHLTWATLALAYVEQVRVNGDVALYDEAEEAVDRSLEIQPDDNVAALTATSALHGVKHEFRDALASADAALEIDPFHPAALVLRVDALTELGRYADQLAALRTADRRQPGVPVAVRFAYAYELRGDLPRATAILRRSATSATGGDRAHVLTLLADLERRRGRTTEAGRLLGVVRRIDPGYLPALISRARLATATGRLGRAARLWDRVVARADHPEHHVELGEIYAATGRHRLAHQQLDPLEEYATEQDSVSLGRELDVALFMADHADPEIGLAAARAEWDSRKGIPAADALGWTLHRTGQSRAGLRFARIATRLGTPDAGFWIHRGLIEASLGLAGPARRHLAYALRLDPGISPAQRQRAARVLDRLT
ncbi:tetratricopeptide repeat protein [Nocardioides sp. HM23]|uniref:tetratricopeptide repeat protein n=1 Tax=Nocardioides bizhenqiangii TaxID=3095076 RepID=UPI002AC9F8E1|nr:tetratricopeptide repeat protein [Nocardioides sp. HM23]MDZ5623611.1 tetratricopeptide repeat protein [Nocardioides sp. HM23]